MLIPVLLCQTLGKFVLLHWSSSLRCMTEHLAIDSGRYLYMNSLHALIAAWLSTFFSGHLDFNSYTYKPVEMFYDIK